MAKKEHPFFWSFWPLPTLTFTGSIEQPLKYKRCSPEGAQKISLSEDTNPKITKRRTQTILLTVATVNRMLDANRKVPTFLSSFIFGVPKLTVAQKSSQETNSVKQGVRAVWGRERIHNQWIPKSKFKSHNLRT